MFIFVEQHLSAKWAMCNEYTRIVASASICSAHTGIQQQFLDFLRCIAYYTYVTLTSILNTSRISKTTMFDLVVWLAPAQYSCVYHNSSWLAHKSNNNNNNDGYGCTPARYVWIYGALWSYRIIHLHRNMRFSRSMWIYW